jgi:hypothetical protein
MNNLTLYSYKFENERLFNGLALFYGNLLAEFMSCIIGHVRSGSERNEIRM